MDADLRQAIRTRDWGRVEALRDRAEGPGRGQWVGCCRGHWPPRVRRYAESWRTVRVALVWTKARSGRWDREWCGKDPCCPSMPQGKIHSVFVSTPASSDSHLHKLQRMATEEPADGWDLSFRPWFA